MARCDDPTDTGTVEVDLTALRAGNGVDVVHGGTATYVSVALSDDGDPGLAFDPDGGLRATGSSSGGGTGGGSGAPSSYVHRQTTPATVWTVTHNLGYDPAGLLVYDVASGALLEGYGVQILTPGVSLRLAFDLSFAGTAYLS